MSLMALQWLDPRPPRRKVHPGLLIGDTSRSASPRCASSGGSLCRSTVIKSNHTMCILCDMICVYIYMCVCLCENTHTYIRYESYRSTCALCIRIVPVESIGMMFLKCCIFSDLVRISPWLIAGLKAIRTVRIIGLGSRSDQFPWRLWPATWNPNYTWGCIAVSSWFIAYIARIYIWNKWHKERKEHKSMHKTPECDFKSMDSWWSRLLLALTSPLTTGFIFKRVCVPFLHHLLFKAPIIHEVVHSQQVYRLLKWLASGLAHVIIHVFRT